MTQRELLCRFAQCKTWKTDLTPMGALAKKLGDPQDKLRFVHVAGTNGKGSTCAMTSSILQEAGYRTGRFVSPYILDFRERIELDGEMIPEADLCRIGEQVLAAVDALEKEGLFPTEFDVVTMVGLLWFWEQHCDVVVLEVGVGGRIDSTNLILPGSVEVSVITSIALDHMAILGDTLSQIAREKSGILKENGTVVLGSAIPEEARSVILSEAARKNNRVVKPSAVRLLESCPDHLRFTDGKTTYTLPMAGCYQLENASTVLAVIDVLREKGWKITQEAVQRGFASTRFPARMELLGKRPLFWLDGAHNPEGAKLLSTSLQTLTKGKKTICLTGMMGDKNCEAVVAQLSPYIDAAITVQPGNPRAMSAKALSSLWQEQHVPAEPWDDLPGAVGRSIDLAGPDGAVICCGSLFLCADVRPLAMAFFKEK